MVGLPQDLHEWWSRRDYTGPALTGRWSRSGELDSPLKPGMLEAVVARQPISVAALLKSELNNGGLLIVVADPKAVTGPRSLLPALIANEDHGERLPLLVHGPTVNLMPPPALSVDYLSWLTEEQTLAESQKPSIVLLWRPDCALLAGDIVDGLDLRRSLCEWLRRCPGDILIAVVSPLSLLARHPPLGALVMNPDLSAVVSNDQTHAPPSPSSLSNMDRVKEFVFQLDAVDRTPTLDFAKCCYLTLSDTQCEAIENPILRVNLKKDASRKHAVLGRLLTDFIQQSWQSRSEFRAALDQAVGAATDARVTAQLYCLLHALAPSGARNTFSTIDLGRWLCLLRSRSYETLSQVLACMEREQLNGVNFVHAPSLEYANLYKAQLERADLYRVNLTQANLVHANLAGADLSRAHLKGADLRDADLRGADLSYTCLEMADLTGAKLDGASLFHAITDNAIGATFP